MAEGALEQPPGSTKDRFFPSETCAGSKIVTARARAIFRWAPLNPPDSLNLQLLRWQQDTLLRDFALLMHSPSRCAEEQHSALCG